MQRKKKSLLAAAHSSLNGWNKFSCQIKWPLLLTVNTQLCVDAALSLICVHFPHCFNLREHDGPSQQEIRSFSGNPCHDLPRRLTFLLHAGIVLRMSKCLNLFLFVIKGAWNNAQCGCLGSGARKTTDALSVSTDTWAMPQKPFKRDEVWSTCAAQGFYSSIVRKTHTYGTKSHKYERYQNAILCYLHTNPNLMESGALLMREAGWAAAGLRIRRVGGGL